MRHWVTVAGIGLIGLIIAADTYEAWQDYRRVVFDNEHVEVAISRAVTEQTERMVQEVDLVLADCASWLTSPEGARSDQPTLVAHLKAQIARLPFVSSAAIADADGRLKASTLSTESMELTEPNVTPLDVFATPKRVPDSGLFIDKLSESGVSGAPKTFALSRRIDVHGTFAGVVIARVAFDYLAGFYAAVHVTPDTSIRLTREDGVTLVEFPDDGVTGEADGTRGSASKKRHRSDGHASIEVSRKVDGYPILVEVSRSQGRVLQPWIQEERSSAARTLALAALAALFLMALRAALKRQAQMDHERRRLERELAAIQRVEALGFLAASVAHDFNNVLTAIVGYAELTRDTVRAEPAAVANVDRMLAATERARLLVRQVLTFDPRRSTSYRPTALAPILREVAQQVRATLPSSLLLQVQGSDETVAVQGDATEIYQVVMNLCSNAVHAMPLGGTVVIRMQTLVVEEPRALALGQLHPGHWACVSISDSGIGLAKEQTAAIFEPFYTTRQPNHGTGIGLTVVRNIITRMNGALDVDSHLGKGTQMAVYWPRVSIPSAGSQGSDFECGRGQTIMVVDDEKELVALTEELLASLCYEPVGFSDARVALEAFRQDPTRFDAILTDDRMLPLRGVEFAGVIHEIDPHIPILLMTGHRDSEIDRLSSAFDIAQILDKPLRVQILREALAATAWRK